MNGIVLFDSGLLLRASTTTLDHASLSLSLWEQAKSGKIRACIAQQTIWEFFSVLTRLGVSHRSVLAEIQKHLLIFPVIAPKAETFLNCLESLRRLRWLNGAQIYDLFLVHTALDNRIDTIYTFNDRPIKRFNLPLKVINPTRF